MTVFSSKTKTLVHKLFTHKKATEVSGKFEIELAAEAVGCFGWTPAQMERIHFTVLKLTFNSESGLDEAIELAKRDWRDLLVAADFSEDLDAHEKWYESLVQ